MRKHRYTYEIRYANRPEWLPLDNNEEDRDFIFRILVSNFYSVTTALRCMVAGIPARTRSGSELRIARQRFA